MELDIAGLDTAGRDELLEQWRSLIGRPPPKHISRALLIQILAFELQTKLLYFATNISICNKIKIWKVRRPLLGSINNS